MTRLLENPGTALTYPDAAVRRIAVAAALSDPHLIPEIIRMLADDPNAIVRRECAETLGQAGGPALTELHHALEDPVPQVREAAVTALGEVAGRDSTDALIAVASNQEEDKLVREAAVAALGAIEDERAVPALLDLIQSAPPQIRRRCVPALSVFEGSEIEAALRSAAEDRNPMVREAAEMVVGRSAG